jgi:AraC-like DNA-binding protein
MLAPHQTEALHRVKQMIEEQLPDAPGYGELCRRVRISEEVLRAGFRQLFGTTPYQYHLDVKFAEVERLLRETDETIAAVGHLAGYEYAPSFVKAFTNRYGCTPGEWRKNVRQRNA